MARNKMIQDLIRELSPLIVKIDADSIDGDILSIQIEGVYLEDLEDERYTDSNCPKCEARHCNGITSPLNGEMIDRLSGVLEETRKKLVKEMGEESGHRLFRNIIGPKTLPMIS